MGAYFQGTIRYRGGHKGVFPDPVRWHSPLAKGFFDNWPALKEEVVLKLGDGLVVWGAFFVRVVPEIGGESESSLEKCARILD
ncbi:hypothetical protein QJS04_geneDACA002489 [Acorus gramineus]|uniref:Uncharacterized protein n=1 Tax=Acorus gramineus TaxID=55184 RepID=A0AAV8ZWN3_ACOGR|nr:hypothetical protein QJS04_geneDACA002489 [Acorus gramineus]